MAKIYFSDCKCDEECINQTLEKSGYSLNRLRNQIWHLVKDDYMIEIVHNYRDGDFGLKIDLAAEARGMSVAKNDYYGLARILVDLCNPRIVYDEVLHELDPSTFRLKE